MAMLPSQLFSLSQTRETGPHQASVRCYFLSGTRITPKLFIEHLAFSLPLVLNIKAQVKFSTIDGLYALTFSVYMKSRQFGTVSISVLDFKHTNYLKTLWITKPSNSVGAVSAKSNCTPLTLRKQNGENNALCSTPRAL